MISMFDVFYIAVCAHKYES